MMQQDTTKRSGESAHAASPRIEISVRDLLLFAMRMHRESRLDAAEKCYRGVLQADPENTNALHYLGVLLHQRGCADEALDLIGRSTSIDAEVAPWHNNLGNVLLDAGRYDDAAVAYARCSALDPDNVEVLNNLGVLLRRLQRPQQAEQTFRRAIARDSRFGDAHANLATLLTMQGRMAEAFSHFADAVALRPSDLNMRRLLVIAYGKAGRFEEGRRVCREWLALEPGDAQALHFLAAYGGADVPERASDRYVEHEFDNFARSFDVKLSSLDYRAPQLVGEAVARLAAHAQPRWRVVDAGCGTGLCGAYLRPFAADLVGVDLSANMLERARARRLYDTLVKSELVAFLGSHDVPQDLVVAADTLCYFGRLGPAFAAVHRSLLGGGHWIFTLEAHERPENFFLQPHGRFSHAHGYVASELETAGFDAVDMRAVVLRLEGGDPVHGWLVCATARAAA